VSDGEDQSALILPDVIVGDGLETPITAFGLDDLAGPRATTLGCGS